MSRITTVYEPTSNGFRFLLIFAPRIYTMQHHPSLITKLKQQLTQPLPGRPAQELMTGRVLPMPDQVPEDARPSGVLALLFPKGDELCLLFIRRTQDGRAHGGQISFPGGRQEDWDANLAATALREAQEEAGIMSRDVEMLGALTPLYIPVSNFIVYPFVGYSETPPEYNLSEQEVAEVLEIPVSYLFDPQHKTKTTVRPSSVPGLELTVPAYQLEDQTIIWGATAMILSELEVIWSA